MERSQKKTLLGGRVAITSGGGSGIGQGIALRLRGEGVRVVVCGWRRK